MSNSIGAALSSSAITPVASAQPLNPDATPTPQGFKSRHSHVSLGSFINLLEAIMLGQEVSPLLSTGHHFHHATKQYIATGSLATPSSTTKASSISA